MNTADAQPRTGSERPPLATRIAERWMRIYGAGLPLAVRADRASELRSDLWEQLNDPEQRRTRQVIGRIARGIPADLLWRAKC